MLDPRPLRSRLGVIKRDPSVVARLDALEGMRARVEEALRLHEDDKRMASNSPAAYVLAVSGAIAAIAFFAAVSATGSVVVSFLGATLLFGTGYSAFQYIKHGEGPRQFYAARYAQRHCREVEGLKDIAEQVAKIQENNIAPLRALPETERAALVMEAFRTYSHNAIKALSVVFNGEFKAAKPSASAVKTPEPS